MPVVNQIELHPYFNQAKQIEADAERHVLTAAWSPLGRASAVLQEPALQAIAQAHGKTISQVILRWDLQLGVMTIPKSAHLSRQKENLNVFDFELTDQEMAAIAQLTKPDGRTKGQDPATYEEF